MRHSREYFKCGRTQMGGWGVGGAVPVTGPGWDGGRRRDGRKRILSVSQSRVTCSVFVCEGLVWS